MDLAPIGLTYKYHWSQWEEEMSWSQIKAHSEWLRFRMQLWQKVEVWKIVKFPISAKMQLSATASRGNAACLSEPLVFSIVAALTIG